MRSSVSRALIGPDARSGRGRSAARRCGVRTRRRAEEKKQSGTTPGVGCSDVGVGYALCRWFVGLPWRLKAVGRDAAGEAVREAATPAAFAPVRQRRTTSRWRRWARGRVRARTLGASGGLEKPALRVSAEERGSCIPRVPGVLKQRRDALLHVSEVRRRVTTAHPRIRKSFRWSSPCVFGQP